MDAADAKIFWFMSFVWIQMENCAHRTHKSHKATEKWRKGLFLSSLTNFPPEPQTTPSQAVHRLCRSLPDTLTALMRLSSVEFPFNSTSYTHTRTSSCFRLVDITLCVNSLLQPGVLIPVSLLIWPDSSRRENKGHITVLSVSYKTCGTLWWLIWLQIKKNEFLFHIRSDSMQNETWKYFWGKWANHLVTAKLGTSV